MKYEFEYTSPEMCRGTAEERLQDDTLQEALDEYIGRQWPEPFGTAEVEPRAVFAPYIAMGTDSERAFLKQASGSGLAPVIATYTDAEFVTANSGLVDCYRPPLKFAKRNVRQWIVDEAQRNGPIGSAETRYDDVNITKYWDAVSAAVYADAGAQPEFTDFGDWYKDQAMRFGWDGDERSKSPYYYNALMALYASGRAVLWDTPRTDYFDRIMEPAASKVYEATGVSPLITNTLPEQKRSWVDLSFLNDEQTTHLLETGRINS